MLNGAEGNQKGITMHFIRGTEENHGRYPGPNIIRLFKSHRMRWTGHAARMEYMRNAYKILTLKI
jgi:hypothetical protein